MPTRRRPKGGTRGTIYKEVARLRIADAEALLEQRRYNGAIYLAGYALECHLKYAVCERKNFLYLPADLEVHDLDKLADAAGLMGGIKAQREMSLLYDALTERWGPELRYGTQKREAKEASHLYNEIDVLYQFFRELVP